jgi:outer membrane lipoprotein-sorting protein
MKRICSIALLSLALAACQQSNDDNFAIDDTNTANGVIETLPPDETVTNETANVADGNSAEAPAELAIPAAFHGRWGMVPADCTSTKGDAKGLIAVDGNSIKFYESVGKLTKVTLNAPENFTGTFAFTGEGQSWTNSQNLKLTGSSNTLVRSETDVAQSYSYKRCA